MRRLFKEILYNKMQENKNIVLITSDLGYGMWDKVKESFPSRFFNFGSAEVAATGAAVGLALGGKIPVVYSITPFLLYRPYEVIRNYINNEKIPVILVGGGRNKDYEHDGFSHWAEDDAKVMQNFTNINSYWPEENSLAAVTDIIFKNIKPTYLNLRR